MSKNMELLESEILAMKAKYDAYPEIRFIIEHWMYRAAKAMIKEVKETMNVDKTSSY